ncbi:hypothetical protein CesoFtcFv8_000032 [Champsocephalus esox]|uniref:Uncharacterized protein n=1 Tax=Champsocephalus esox TaxID=159716 RepID=A0AAN8HXS5_9TELE|nr:hypothetical protein CesoFtcFv8_000032 [Champsocephalus esox]
MDVPCQQMLCLYWASGSASDVKLIPLTVHCLLVCSLHLPLGGHPGDNGCLYPGKRFCLEPEESDLPSPAAQHSLLLELSLYGEIFIFPIGFNGREVHTSF